MKQVFGSENWSSATEGKAYGADENWEQTTLARVIAGPDSAPAPFGDAAIPG
ncbi:MAG TPA: hypothetical protein VK714_09025 [Myxococcota bacterium]|nr:hypothetical protein [Myxococcota bacterium]